MRSWLPASLRAPLLGAELDPSAVVFDFQAEGSRLVRCLRIEIPGRRVCDGSRSVDCEVEIGYDEARIPGGTAVYVKLTKSSDLPAEPKLVLPVDGPQVTCLADKSGIWEKTFDFRDGLWELYEPTVGDLQGVDAHGVVSVYLVRVPPPAGKTRASSKGGMQTCNTYDISSLCAASDLSEIGPSASAAGEQLESDCLVPSGAPDVLVVAGSHAPSHASEPADACSELNGASGGSSFVLP